MHEKQAKPIDGKYCLELKLGWSTRGLTVLVSTPVILSLVVGTWYMQAHDDIVAAWTIALYIITAAGGESTGRLDLESSILIAGSHDRSSGRCYPNRWNLVA